MLSTDSHPATGRDYGSPHIVGFFFFTTNHTNRNDQLLNTEGFSFEATPMNTIIHTHSSQTGVEFSRHTQRSESWPYSPRTGARSKCVQKPWGVDLTMDLTTADAFKTQWVFSFLPRQNRQIPTGTTHAGLWSKISDHNIKGLLFLNQKRLCPFPTKSTHSVRKWQKLIGK